MTLGRLEIPTWEVQNRISHAIAKQQVYSHEKMH